MTKNIQETKEKIIEAFEGIKEFEVSYVKEVYYSKTFKAKSKKELKDRFYNKELDFDNKDICDRAYCDGSLEIDEAEK